MVGKVTYKGTKKGLLTAINKAEEKSRKKSTRIAMNSKIISKDLVDYLSSELKSKTVRDDEITDLDKKANIEKIRQGNLEEQEKFQEELLQENKESMNNVRATLYSIKNQKVYMELASKFGLSEQDITKILSSISIDEQGDLVVPKGLPISKEELDGTELENNMKKLASMPKIDDLSDAQVRTLVKALKIENGEISFDLPEDLPRSDSELLELAEALKGKDLYSNGIEGLLPKLSKECSTSELDVKLLEEIRLREELGVAVELDNQMSVIFENITELNSKENKTMEEKDRRNQLRKIAEKKVKQLEKAKIVRTIEQGKNKTKRIVSNARDILLPLEKARDTGDKQLEELIEPKSQDDDL